jgi:toxin-antitoxin system PIN domain toxin
MKPCLADVNVFLPLLVRHHEHHELAVKWFEGLAAGEAVLCRFVQLALIRLLGNRKIMGKHALSAVAAWSVLSELLEDERVEFVAEPAGLDAALVKLLRYPVPTPKLVGDSYLAAFSIAGQLRLATVDQGFREFRGVDLWLLAT